jgi:hypothetical protein
MSEQGERSTEDSENGNPDENDSLMRIRISFSPDNDSFNERNFTLRQQLLRELERLRSIITGEGDPYQKLFNNLSKEEQKDFRNFYETFSNCPICSAENHKSYLLKFFLSKNPQKVELKESLVRIWRNLKQINKQKYEHLNLGIPCCKCYSRLIEKTR